MNSSLEASILVASKRRERNATPVPAGFSVVSVDRTHPVLGNRHYLHNHLDDAERRQVIALNRADL